MRASDDNIKVLLLLTAPLVLLGGFCTMVSVSEADHARRRKDAVAALSAARRIALADVPAHEGEEVMVRGWAAGTWGRRAGEIDVGAPVVHCETWAEQRCCTPKPGDPDEEECRQCRVRVDDRRPPLFSLQPAPSPPGALEAAPGAVTIDAAAASFPFLPRLAGNDRWEVVCLRADREITVFGRVRGGAIREGRPFYVTDEEADALIAAVRGGAAEAASGSRWSRRLAVGCFALAAALVAGFVIATRRR